jgi:hypothetical protein
VGSSPTPGTQLTTGPLCTALPVLAYNYAINLRAISPVFLFESMPVVRRLAASRSLLVLMSAALSAQAADIAGWRDLPWGSGKAAVLKALESSHIREVSVDELVVDEFRLNGMSYRVALFFLPKYGLGKVTMTSEADRDSFQKALSDLTSRYGKPGLRAEYDGDREITLTVFQWTTPHGRLSLSSDYGDGASGYFTIVYESAVNR